jgi:hypothetical protein
MISDLILGMGWFGVGWNFGVSCWKDRWKKYFRELWMGFLGEGERENALAKARRRKGGGRKEIRGKEGREKRGG